MKRLLKNGIVVNVFTDELEKANVLIENGKIIGVGSYDDADADIVEDLNGKYVSPGFIDGHIHIESSMLVPCELAKMCLPHGTTSIVADPHEIANVCGTDGIQFMLDASEGLPMTVYIVLPSCVPATGFDENGAVLEAEDLYRFYSHPRVLGLGEVMNYPAVIGGDPKIMKKIEDALSVGKVVNGHAPMILGRNIDKYISAGIYDDHESSTLDEAKEQIRKGQYVMIRRGSAARNLIDLISLFEEPWNRRCMLVTDDYHADDLLEKGHINSIIREAVGAGKSAVVGIRMATIQAAQRFKLHNVGAIAPGYTADIAILESLENMSVSDVYKNGEKVVDDKKIVEFKEPCVSEELTQKVRGSFNLKTLCKEDFIIAPKSNKCRGIRINPGTLYTDEVALDIDFSVNNGVDAERDILKLAVIERYKNSGHIGLGYVSGIGMKKGAIASSVSHDSHNLIVVGASDSDMALAANRIKELGGGCLVVCDGQILLELPLPFGGLMTDSYAQNVAEQNKKLGELVAELGVNEGINPFMNMSFVALPVIPHLKMTTNGLIDVENQKLVSIYL